MSPAEQKRKKRAEKAQRDLMAELLKIYRRMQMTPTFDPKHPEVAVKTAAQIRREQTRFFEELKALPVFELKMLLETWKKESDNHGRLRNERSGEARQRNGQSEIETIAEQQRAYDEGGRKVKPQGSGPDQDDDPTADTADIARPNLSAVRQEQRSNEAIQEQKQLLDDKLHLVALWMTKDGACCVCGSTEGEDHIWKKFYECTSAEAKLLAMHRAGAPNEFKALLYAQIDHAHLDKMDELLHKRWTFFASVDDRLSVHGETTEIKIRDLIERGWAFFSRLSDRTETILPSQAVVRAFFGHFRFTRKQQSGE
jgi:hypothetical protein